MDSTICSGCHLRVEPIRTFEQSKKSKQWWRITKCPRERCGFNIDIEECDKPGASTGKTTIYPPPDKKKSKDDDSDRSFWNYGL